jgi:hypothetical protein
MLDFYNVKPKKTDDNEIFPIEHYEKNFIMRLADKFEQRKNK